MVEQSEDNLQKEAQVNSEGVSGVDAYVKADTIQDAPVQNVAVQDVPGKDITVALEEVKRSDPVTFKEKLAAWWREEYKFGVPDALKNKPSQINEEQVVKKKKRPPRLEPLVDPKVWTKDRINLCRDIWEEDYSDEIVAPEHPRFSLELAVYLNLMPGTTVLDMFAGIGGFSRILSKRLDVWVVGMETEAALVAENNAISHSHGVEKKVICAQYDPLNFELSPNRYTATFIRERFHSIEDKGGIIKSVRASLQDGGHMVITDYMLSSPDMANHPDVLAWLEVCPYPVYLWGVEQYQKAIKEGKMFFHVKQDKTGEILKIYEKQIKKFSENFSMEGQAPNMLRYVGSELEHWLKLEKALKSGALMYVRLHASKS